jgi:undecaprenyl-diphosphatase
MSVEDGPQDQPSTEPRESAGASALPWLLCFTVCLVFAAALLLSIETRSTAGADRTLDLNLHHAVNRPWDRFFAIVSNVGGPNGRDIATAAATVFLFWRRLFRDVVLLLTSVGGAVLLETVLKASVLRPRPRLFPHVVPASGWSFPSGHVTGTTALLAALVALLWLHRLRPLARILGALGVAAVLLVGLSRVVLGVHFPTDVAGGFFIGVGWSALCVAVTLLPPFQFRGRTPQPRRSSL